MISASYQIISKVLSIGIILVAFFCYQLPAWLTLVLLTLSLLLWQAVSKQSPRQLSLIFSFVIFAAAFLAARLWFFLDFPLPAIFPDSEYYYTLAQQISAGYWPDFSIRPPVYPLLVWFAISISEKLMAIIIIQSLLAFSAMSLLIYAVWKLKWQLCPLASLAMIFWATNAATLEHETALLSESTYASLLIIVFSLLMLSFAAPHKPFVFALLSCCMGLSILTRPAAMFLLVIFLLIVGYLYWNKFGQKHLLYFLIPMPALLLSICFYNWIKIGAFAINTFGETNLIGVTGLLLEQDQSYPEQLNKVIERFQHKKQELLSLEEQKLLENSWDKEKLVSIYQKTYNPMTNLGGISRKLIRQVSFDAINKKPDQYLKFVWIQLQEYFWFDGDYDLASQVIVRRAKYLYVDRIYDPDKTYRSGLAKEYTYQPMPKNLLLKKDGAELQISPAETVLLSLYRRLRQRLTALLNTPWVSLFTITLVLSIIRLAQTKASHNGAFISFILTISMFGASLIVCLVEIALERYAYPMEWVYFLMPALLCLLLQKQTAILASNVVD